MPHYKDGTEAKVGDQVVGVLYNSGPAPKAGAIISITRETESCNAMVQFTEIVPRESAMPKPRMALAIEPRALRNDTYHGGTPDVFAYTCADYCSTNELTKIV